MTESWQPTTERALRNALGDYALTPGWELQPGMVQHAPDPGELGPPVTTVALHVRHTGHGGIYWGIGHAVRSPADTHDPAYARAVAAKRAARDLVAKLKRHGVAQRNVVPPTQFSEKGSVAFQAMGPERHAVRLIAAQLGVTNDAAGVTAIQQRYLKARERGDHITLDLFSDLVPSVDKPTRWARLKVWLGAGKLA